jgi:hypothetical protein
MSVGKLNNILSTSLKGSHGLSKGNCGEFRVILVLLMMVLVLFFGFKKSEINCEKTGVGDE